MLCKVDKKSWFRRGSKKLQETFSSHWDRLHRSRFNISWTTKISQRWKNCKQHNIFILHFLRLTKHLVWSSPHLKTKSAFRITRTSPTSKDTGERLWSCFYLLKGALVMVLLKDSLLAQLDDSYLSSLIFQRRTVKGWGAGGYNQLCHPIDSPQVISLQLLTGLPSSAPPPHSS